MIEPTNQQSREIRLKFTELDVSLATGRAERFLAARYPDYPASEHPAHDLLIAVLADYDLYQLDEMFSGVEVGE